MGDLFYSMPATTSDTSVTAIQFQDEHTLISSSDLDGIIKVWDLRKSYDRYSRYPNPKNQFSYPGKSALKGYSALILNHAKTQLFASCKDHTIYKFDVAAHEEKPLAAYTGFENNSKYFSRLSLSAGNFFSC
jgi:WD40 repeat protein